MTIIVDIRASFARLAQPPVSPRADLRRRVAGIFVQPRPKGGAFIVGTDGHALIAIIDPSAKCERPSRLLPDRYTLSMLPKVGSMSDHEGKRLRLGSIQFDGKKVPSLMVTKAHRIEHIQTAEPTSDEPYVAWERTVPNDLSSYRRGADRPINHALLEWPFRGIHVTKNAGVKVAAMEMFSGAPGAPMAVRLANRDDILLLLATMTLNDDEKDRGRWKKRFSGLKKPV